jgi:RNA polymerase sigma factor (sigma-70 family)
MLADRYFLSRLRDRAESAIQELFDQYYARIYRYLARLVDDPQTAADLAQETFLKAFVALHQLEDDSNVSAWLFQIATNLARSYHRRRRLIRWLPLDRAPASARHEDDFAQRDPVDPEYQGLAVP